MKGLVYILFGNMKYLMLFLMRCYYPFNQKSREVAPPEGLIND
jgi:hypothetical protein